MANQQRRKRVKSKSLVRYCGVPRSSEYNKTCRLKTALYHLGFSEQEVREFRDIDDEVAYRKMRDKFLEMSRKYHPDFTGDDGVQKSLCFYYSIAKKRIKARRRDYVDAMNYATVRI